MKQIIFIKILFTVLILLNSNNTAQPYIYLISTYEPDARYSNIEKLDLSTGYISKYLDKAGRINFISTDKTNNWLFFQNRSQLEVVNCLNNSNATILLENVQAASEILYNDSLNQFVVLYESLNGNEGISLRFVAVNTHEVVDSLTNLDLFDEENIYLSKDKIKLYFTVFDTLTSKIYLVRYSIIEKHIIDRIVLDSLGIEQSPNTYKIVDDIKIDHVLLSYLQSENEIDQFYQVYDLTDHFTYSPIHYPFRSYGYLSSDTKYIIFQKSLLKEDTQSSEYFTGAIDIYRTATGKLIRNLLLPPNGKIFLFDNYPDKFFYYVQETQQAITIELNNIENEFFLHSIIPSTILINTASFDLEVKGRGFDTVSTVYFNSQPKTTTFISDSVLTAEILPSDIEIVGSFPVWVKDRYSISDTLQFTVTQTTNPNLVVNLKNSLGNQIPASNVMYYEGSWKDAVDNGDGTFTVITTKPTISVRVFYEGANQTVNNVPAQNSTYTFVTVNAAVQLKNSLGSLIDVGTVQYYAGAWRSFGTTSNGVAYKELLPINYSFRMTYEFGSIDKQQDVSSDPTVVFQTVNAAVELRNSSGNLMDEGTVQYYAGAWRTFGTTSNGVAYKELLPINYSFRMTHEFVSKDKQQNLGTNPVVDFSTVLCSVKVNKTSNNQPINSADVKYYSLAWRDIGITNGDGITTKELLPVNLSFRASLGNVSLDKQQDISVNSLVEILLNVP
ncbi:MAG: IPT/TIG domain-containing protein [Ignavibacteriota bacterium]